MTTKSDNMFSIIVPVYNVEPYLRQCLESVINQDYSDYEIICINDGSTDNSPAILQKYGKACNQIKIINQENHGLSTARNIGIREASGDYILFLDSDDCLEPNALQILAAKQNNEDMICFNGRRCFEDGTTEKPDNGIEENSLTGWEYYNKYGLVTRKFHFVCTVLRIYKRSFLLENNLFFKVGILHEDNLFTPIACYYALKVKVIPDCLYVYRIREGSITQTINVKRIFDILIVANTLSDFFIPKVEIIKSQVYREIAGEYFSSFTAKSIENYGNLDKEIIKLIDWVNFKEVSVYPRHRRIYKLLKINPVLFRIYMLLETLLKK